LAAYKAALACERGAMVTRAVHSELVFCLSPTRHISEAFRRFGGDENTRALIVCKFDANDEDLERVRSVVKGELVAFDARPAVDEAALKKWYKVHENELEIGSLADAVLSRIAIRDVA
jgi:EKC/KEOPS complex subunit CGI121/TPRKB